MFPGRELGLATHETEKQAKEKELEKRLKAESDAKIDEAHEDRLLRMREDDRCEAVARR